MNFQDDARLGPVEIQALLDRAQRYRDDSYRRTGRYPESFIVTEYEDHLLRRYYSHGHPVDPHEPVVNDELQLHGMRVCGPQRVSWYRAERVMTHVRIGPGVTRPTNQSDPLPCSPLHLEPCRTERPASPQRDIACPCGEVIWDLSTCLWDDVPTALWAFPIVVDPTLAPGEWRMLSEATGRRFDQRLAHIMAAMEEALPHARQAVDDEWDTVASMQASWDRAIADGELTHLIGRDVVIRLQQAVRERHQRAVHDPLPPLDDLDEGLQCCGHRQPTFADYMKHRRLHGER